MSIPELELRGIHKSFGGVPALRNVSMRIRGGEVHALIGENGAGKSTLMKVLSGAYRADHGSIVLDGSECVVTSPAAARDRGIAMIYQELTIAPHLTVEENLTLGIEQSRAGFLVAQRDRIAHALSLVGHPSLPLSAKAGSLPIGLQQVVEIARALLGNARLIIMDEPTSSLTAEDTQKLFGVIRELRASGIGIIYISHFLEEVKEIADTFTVLRDGEVVGSGMMNHTSIEQIIEMMVGRTLKEMYPPSPYRGGEVLLSIDGLEGTPIPHGISFTLHRGEIFGIAGLVGSGRSETLRRIFGLDRTMGGSLSIGHHQVPLRAMKPPTALRMGIDFLSENRKEEGLASRRSVAENMTLSSLRRFARLNGAGLVRSAQEYEAVRGRIQEMHIRCTGPSQSIASLSGGNQQKVVFSRMLEQGADVLLLDEPTRGIDVGSKAEIYRLMRSLAAEGRGIVFVSSYLPELLGVCDTIAVMHRGIMSAGRPSRQWDPTEIMHIATSGI